jgi:glucokinase
MSAALVADIGGSNSRFGLANSAGWPERIAVIENDTVPDLETAVESYLKDTGERPQAAVLAIAGPIQGEEIALTNRAWSFRRADFAARFGFSQLHIVNDFEAVAWALPRLTGKHVRPLGQGGPGGHGVKLVLGPGTGLGVAALLPADGRWYAVASEGGHASFGPRAAEEDEMFARLRAEVGGVSAEMVLSGPGLLRLARALHPERAYPDSESVVADAQRSDPVAHSITRTFVHLLGRFAGDLALTFKATGGVYITGGVAFALGPLLDDPGFRAAFEEHPPYQELLGSIPTLLITCEQPGLIGCGTLVQMHLHMARAPAPA